MQENHIIFDRPRWRKRRQRAARDFAAVNYLAQEAAERLADRVQDMTRDFPVALAIGAPQGVLKNALGDCRVIGQLIEADDSPAMLSGAGPHLVCDPEWLPVAPNSVDAVFSLLHLQWINDLPGALIQIRQALKPDGLFLGILPGARTLQELRHCLADAELEIAGGISPRVSPFVEVRDAGALLQRAGFALPVVDSDLVHVSYPNVWVLMQELRAMGETNALMQRPRHFTRRSIFVRAAELYTARHGDAEGRITATVEFVTLTAWAPHSSQQQPARRGSGKVLLGDYFNTAT